MLVVCPFYKSVINVVLIIALIALGTVGLFFLNLWVAVGFLIYSILWYFLVMPIKHCQYCYYRVKETPIDSKKGKLLPIDEWKESYLTKHVDCGKKWGFNFFITWFIPIVLICISFFFNYDIVALLSLIGFIVVLALMLIHVRWKVCPTCAIQEECHAAF